MPAIRPFGSFFSFSHPFCLIYQRGVIALPKETKVSNITEKGNCRSQEYQSAGLIAKLTRHCDSSPTCCSNYFCTVTLPASEEYSIVVEPLRKKIISQPSSSATISLSLSLDLLSSLLSSSIHSLDKLICF